jgi:putative ABC transport system ATP-binding protein
MYIPLKPLFSRHKGIGVQFSDEPTGNLDSKNSQDVIDLLTKASRHYQQTILMITHNNGLTSMVDRVLRVTDGVLTDLGGNANEKLS